jgi:hypothetical protein
MTNISYSVIFSVLLGISIMIFGCTRWYTIRSIISEHEKIVNVVHKEYAIDTQQTVFTLDDMSKMAADIRVRVYDSKGPYQWIEGLLFSMAIGLSCLLFAIYMRSQSLKK